MKFLRSLLSGRRRAPASPPWAWQRVHQQLREYRGSLGYEVPPFIGPSVGELPDPRQAALPLDPIKVRIDRKGVTKG